MFYVANYKMLVMLESEAKKQIAHKRKGISYPMQSRGINVVKPKNCQHPSIKMNHSSLLLTVTHSSIIFNINKLEKLNCAYYLLSTEKRNRYHIISVYITIVRL